MRQVGKVSLGSIPRVRVHTRTHTHTQYPLNLTTIHNMRIVCLRVFVGWVVYACVCSQFSWGLSFHHSQCREKHSPEIGDSGVGGGGEEERQVSWLIVYLGLLGFSKYMNPENPPSPASWVGAVVFIPGKALAGPRISTELGTEPWSQGDRVPVLWVLPRLAGDETQTQVTVTAPIPAASHDRTRDRAPCPQVPPLLTLGI